MSRRLLAFHVLVSSLVCLLSREVYAQAAKASPGAPPKVLLLVHQQMIPGKAGERQRLEVETSRRFDALNVPITWIELEAVTGPPQALFFDPANSFEELDRAGAMLGDTFAAHPELAQLQQQIEERLASSKTVVAVRRDELGLGTDRVDLTKARYLRITVVSLRPGHERDFAAAQNILTLALSRSHAEAAWVVYEVNSGMTQPTFLVVEALRSLRDIDKELDMAHTIQQTLAETEQRHLDQIAQEAYMSVERNLYAFHPDMSHVAKEFASGDPAFWTPDKK